MTVYAIRKPLKEFDLDHVREHRNRLFGQANNISFYSVDVPNKPVEDALIDLLKAFPSIQDTVEFHAYNDFDTLSFVPFASRIITNCINITSLTITYCQLGDAAGEAFFKCMETNHTIRTLMLRSVDMSDEIEIMMGAMLAVNDTLFAVDVSYAFGSDRGCNAILCGLGANDSVEEFAFNGTHNAWGPNMEAANALVKNTRLKELKLTMLNFNPCSAYALQRILEGNRSIQSLTINEESRETHIGIAIADGLAKNSTLKRLFAPKSVFCESVLSAILAAISGPDHVSALTHLILSRQCKISSLAYLLETNHVLRELQVGVKTAYSEEMSRVRRAVQFNPSIESIPIFDSLMQTQGHCNRNHNNNCCRQQTLAEASYHKYQTTIKALHVHRMAKRSKLITTTRRRKKESIFSRI